MVNHRFYLVLAACLVTATPSTAHAELQCTPFNAMGIQRCQAGLPTPIASTISAYQQASQWCWAASISMVFRHYGLNISQPEIVRQAWGGIVDLPGTAQEIAASLNRTWTDANGDKWRVSSDTYRTEPAVAAQDLVANRPLIIGTMGHAMVLTALTYDRDPSSNGNVTLATVRDPWPGRGGRRDLTAEEWYSTNLLMRVKVERVPR